jgi:hypothetical protein
MFDVLYMIDVVDDSSNDNKPVRLHRRGQLPFPPQLEMGVRLDPADVDPSPYPVDSVTWDDDLRQFEVYFGAWWVPTDKFQSHFDRLQSHGWVEVKPDGEAQD